MVDVDAFLGNCPGNVAYAIHETKPEQSIPGSVEQRYFDNLSLVHMLLG